MGDKIELTLQDRVITGKAVRALRRDGFVPAVMYGPDLTPQAVMAPQMAITKAFKVAGRHQPIELHVGSDKRLAMIKSADLDPVKRTLRHVSFHVIKQNEKITTEVPIQIELSGETPAEKAGLVVLTTIDAVEIEALPRNLPEHVSLPGAKLVEVGDHLTVADVEVPEGVTVLSDPTQIVATVYEPSALQAANEAAGGDAEDESDVAADHGEEAAPAEADGDGKKPGAKE